MITKELVEQWAADCNVTASNAFRASTHDLDCIYKAWPEELQAFAQRAQRAEAHGAAERERELMAVGMIPSYFQWTFTNSGGREQIPLYTAEQLAAARLQGSEEERKKIAEVVRTQSEYSLVIASSGLRLVKLGPITAQGVSQGEQAKPLTDEQIEKLREKTFSTNNPYCPVDSKSMRKAVHVAEAAHGIGVKEQTT